MHLNVQLGAHHAPSKSTSSAGVSTSSTWSPTWAGGRVAGSDAAALAAHTRACSGGQEWVGMLGIAWMWVHGAASGAPPGMMTA